MQQEDRVLASDFCAHHDIELTFIYSLQEYGMIETIQEEEKIFLPLSQMARLERIVRLRYELDISLEGIETITHLLDRMEEMQRHIARLTNRLKAYES